MDGRVTDGGVMTETVAGPTNSLHDVTGLRVGHAQRIGDGWHFVIHDFLTDVAAGARTALRAGDDAAEAHWVRTDQLANQPGLVAWLLEFLVDHGLVDG